MKLVRIVECHLLDTHFGSIANIGLGLARLSIDDAGRIDSQLQHLFDFRLGGTVEAGAKLGKQAENLVVRVTFDS